MARNGSDVHGNALFVTFLLGMPYSKYPREEYSITMTFALNVLIFCASLFMIFYTDSLHQGYTRKSRKPIAPKEPIIDLKNPL